MSKETTVMRWKYEAIAADGKVKKGFIAAETRADAIEVLTRDGLIPSNVTAATGNILQFELFPSKEDRPLKLKVAARAVFARQLYLLVRSGLQLSRAVEVVGEDNSDIRYTRMCRDVADKITAGSPLSMALANYEKCFDDVFISYVRAGEVTGDLEGALKLLSEQLEQQQSLKLKVKGVTAYPKLMGAAIAVMVLGILMFLVPKYEKIYANLGSELPLPTRAVMAMSRAISPINMDLTMRPPFIANLIPEGRTIVTAPLNFTSPILWIIGGVIGWFQFRKRTRGNLDISMKVEKAKFRFPVLGKLAKNVMLHRWATTLAGGLHSGLSTVEALGVAADASGSAWVKKATIDLVEAVRTGKPLSTAVKQHPDLFDVRIRAMTSSGEEAGELAEMFDSIAFSYTDEIETQVASLGARLEVGLLLIMGIVVGVLLVALYLPIFGLAENVGNSYSE